MAEEPEPGGGRRFPAVHTADERTLLAGVLDWYRAGVLAKVAGVGAEHASTRPFRSETSIAGLVKFSPAAAGGVAHLGSRDGGWTRARKKNRDCRDQLVNLCRRRRSVRQAALRSATTWVQVSDEDS